MFDIGFAELLVLAVIAMVVIGPEKLPGVARTVGQTMGKARRMMTNLQKQIEQEVKLDELNKKIMAETKDMDFTKNTIHPNHDNEDAEVPTSPPDINETEDESAMVESAVSAAAAATENTSAEEAHVSDVELPEAPVPTVSQVDKSDQISAENDVKRS